MVMMDRMLLELYKYTHVLFTSSSPNKASSSVQSGHEEPDRSNGLDVAPPGPELL
jgi:hypothetical protein